MRINLKSRISALIARGHGIARINNIATLVYTTEDMLGRPCNDLYLIFKNVNGETNAGYIFPIHGRSYLSIIEEVKLCTKEYFIDIADNIISDLQSGYSFV